MQSLRTSNFMPLDVSSDVLAIVQRVCDKALNVAKARATSSALGPRVGMKALYGKTVKRLPRGEGVVKDRVVEHGSGQHASLV